MKVTPTFFRRLALGVVLVVILLLRTPGLPVWAPLLLLVLLVVGLGVDAYFWTRKRDASR